jgi:hypothetical protein
MFLSFCGNRSSIWIFKQITTPKSLIHSWYTTFSRSQLLELITSLSALNWSKLAVEVVFGWSARDHPINQLSRTRQLFGEAVPVSGRHIVRDHGPEINKRRPWYGHPTTVVHVGGSHTFFWFILCYFYTHFQFRDLFSLVACYAKSLCLTTLSMIRFFLCSAIHSWWPPLWSSSQSSWLQIWRPGFDSRHYQKKKTSRGSGTGSTQPREYNWGATW